MLQFQPDSLSLAATLLRDLRPEMLSETAAVEWLFRNIHPERYACPDCGREIDSARDRERFLSRERIRCGASECRRSFDWRTGTILSGVALSPREILLLAILFALGTTPGDITDRLGIDRNTVRDWRDRLSIPGGRVLASTPIGEGSARARGAGSLSSSAAVAASSPRR